MATQQVAPEQALGLMARRVQSFLMQFWLPALSLLLLGVLTANIDSLYLPPLTDVFSDLVSSWFGSRLLTDVMPSLSRMFAGLFLSIVLGIALGLVLGLVPRLRRMTSPMVEFLRGMPSPALLPFAMVLFGVGDTMKVFVIVLVAVFPVLLNTIDGVIGIDSTKVMTCDVYSITGRDRLTRVVVPAALPQIFAGVRTSFALALIMMVFSEILSSTNGIGHVILVAQRNYDMITMWSGIMFLGLLGYLLNSLLVFAENYMLAWHRGARESSLT